MKRKLTLIFILILVILAATTVGCKKKIEDKISEKFVEQMTGANVDINKDTTTISTEQGETKVGENLEWPEDKMGSIPEIKASIIMIAEDKENNTIMIYFDGFKREDAEEYMEGIKELYRESTFESSGSDGIMYSGKNEDGAEVLFSHYNDGAGTLAYMDKSLVSDD